MSSRSRLLRWTGWFALVNAALLALVGLRYLWHYATLGPSAAWIYALLAFVGQMSAFAYVPFFFLPNRAGGDRTLTREWFEWLGQRDPSRPFFGFLYYNAAVAFEPPDDYPSVVPVPPGAPAQVVKRARYLTGIRFIDELLRGVLDDLERRKLLDRTVIVVTSDHGMEFDENGLGFSLHNTAYSELQLHTPLLVRGPGRSPGCVSRRASDYASGQDLFDGRPWEWLIAASHRSFALVEPDQVTIVSPTGYEIRDGNYRLVRHAALPRDRLRAAQQEMRRFYRP